MAITKAQIFQVADELDEIGKNPTLAAVRKAIGGGSYTTIQEAMTEWKKRKRDQEAPVIEAAPKVVADKMTEFGAALWAVALDLANARLDAERETLATQRIELEAAKSEAAELADQLTHELEDARGTIETLTQTEDDSRKLIEDMGQRLAAAEANAKSHKQQLTNLVAERDESREQAAKAREEAANLSGQLVAQQEQAAAILARLTPK